MVKLLSDKYSKDPSVDSLKWWIEAAKETTKYLLRENNLSVPDDSILNNVEKVLSIFARDMLGRMDLSPDAHKRVSWVSSAESSEDLKDIIRSAEIIIRKTKKKSVSCCEPENTNPNRKPF